jgi:hypothetical protein
MQSATDERLRELLAFEAPYVAEKLLLNKTVSTLEEGQQLFEEAKKYLWLVATDRARDYPVGSLRVDEAWHQFFLFTRECRELCLRIFGCFMHHAPPTKEEPSDAATPPPRPLVSYAELGARYREVFGIDLPAVWDDALSVEPGRRVLRNDLGGPLTLRRCGEKIELLQGEEGAQRVRLRIDAWAAPALEFALTKGIFYVRELPTLEPEEQIDLCRALVRENVLLVAP